MDDSSFWFLSTVAQATSAIIGLIGAVIGAKIFDHLKEMSSQRAEIEKPLNDYRLEIKNLVVIFEKRQKFYEEKVNIYPNGVNMGGGFNWIFLGGNETWLETKNVSKENIEMYKIGINIISNMIIPRLHELEDINVKILEKKEQLIQKIMDECQELSKKYPILGSFEEDGLLGNWKGILDNIRYRFGKIEISVNMYKTKLMPSVLKDGFEIIGLLFLIGVVIPFFLLSVNRNPGIFYKITTVSIIFLFSIFIGVALYRYFINEVTTHKKVLEDEEC